LNACVVLSAILLLFSIIRRPLRSTLFPYTTLFRSSIGIEGGVGTVRSVRLSNAQTTSPSPSPTAPSFAPNASIAVLTHSRLMNGLWSVMGEQVWEGRRAPGHRKVPGAEIRQPGAPEVSGDSLHQGDAL